MTPKPKKKVCEWQWSYGSNYFIDCEKITIDLIGGFKSKNCISCGRKIRVVCGNPIKVKGGK